MRGPFPLCEILIAERSNYKNSSKNCIKICQCVSSRVLWRRFGGNGQPLIIQGGAGRGTEAPLGALRASTSPTQCGVTNATLPMQCRLQIQIGTKIVVTSCSSFLQLISDTCQNHGLHIAVDTNEFYSALRIISCWGPMLVAIREPAASLPLLASCPYG